MRRSVSGITILSLVLGLVGALGLPATVAHAATSPSLGAAETFGVLADTYTNTVAGTTINGNLGYTTPPAVNPTVNGDTHDETPLYFQAGTDRTTALNALNIQSCDFNFVGPTDISLLAQPFLPGVYCFDAAVEIGTGGITLSGGGTYIFRMDGALTSAANSVVTFSGPICEVNDVFWTPTAAVTLGADTTFMGTVIADAGITVGANTTWTGRSLAFGGTVTTDTDTISVAAACPEPPGGGSGAFTGTITLVKTVINDNGGTDVVADFPLFLDGNAVVSGESNAFSFFSGEAHVASETTSPDYALTFSGDCDANGNMFLDPAENLFCVLTNDDIGAPVVVPPVPPLIAVVKVPSPLALPGGPGPVTYTYTVRNIGTVPMTNVTMVGDSCGPLVRVSGDVDGDNQLDVTEVWVYTCSTTLTETHTNTVVATGWANGLSAVDVASATVVVGIPLVPPLIHVTKVPSPLTLPAGGGMVTYTMVVTNPGTAAMSNITVSDSRCGGVTYVSGDADGDSMLDVTESWTYTCQAQVTSNTTNTVSVSGTANGFIVRDLAIAPVLVAGEVEPVVPPVVPTLPTTGFGGGEYGFALWGLLAAAASILIGRVGKRLFT